MKKKTFYIILIVLAIFGLISVKSNLIIDKFSPEQTSTSNDINVLFITIDTLRPDHLGAYGYERDTSPNIDKIARQGVLFSNAMAQSTVTWPTLASTMTSTYPETHGILTNKMLVDLSMPTIAEILKKNDFATAAFVSNMCKKDKSKRQDVILNVGKGFDKRFCGGSAFIDSSIPQTEWDKDITVNAIDWLKNNKEKKFFLWLHYIDPHNPYQPPRPYDEIFDPDYKGNMNGSNEQIKYIQKEMVNLSMEDYNHVIALYDGEVLSTDRYIGELMDAVEGYNLTDNTLIIISADHGEQLYEHFYYFKHGCTLYDSELKVPLIAKLPSMLPEGKVIEDQVQSIDVAPTILDILGIPRGTEMQGKSLIPLINEGNSTNLYTYSQLADKVYSIRTNQWKYIYNPEEINTCPRAGNFNLEKVELYDIKNDTKETKNLIGYKEEVAEKLRWQLQSWLDTVKRNETVIERPLDKETEEMLKALGYVV